MCFFWSVPRTSLTTGAVQQQPLSCYMWKTNITTTSSAAALTAAAAAAAAGVTLCATVLLIALL
jgi:hypothetical protein